MSDLKIELILKDPEATEALGRALARAFPGAPEGSAALHLTGDLGAGKTTCVRALLRELGITGLVRSPTFTLVETYQTKALSCIHVDLYRLKGPAEVDELGLRDYMNPECLFLIEWPERAGIALPTADLELDLSFAESGRRCRLRAGTMLGEGWLRNLRHDTRLASYLSNLT